MLGNARRCCLDNSITMYVYIPMLDKPPRKLKSLVIFRKVIYFMTI